MSFYAIVPTYPAAQRTRPSLGHCPSRYSSIDSLITPTPSRPTSYEGTSGSIKLDKDISSELCTNCATTMEVEFFDCEAEARKKIEHLRNKNLLELDCCHPLNCRHSHELRKRGSIAQVVADPVTEQSVTRMMQRQTSFKKVKRVDRPRSCNFSPERISLAREEKRRCSATLSSGWYDDEEDESDHEREVSGSLNRRLSSKVGSRMFNMMSKLGNQFITRDG